MRPLLGTSSPITSREQGPRGIYSEVPGADRLVTVDWPELRIPPTRDPLANSPAKPINGARHPDARADSRMLHAGLDRSRNRIDVCLLSQHGELVAEFATPSDADGVCALAPGASARRAGAQRDRVDDRCTLRARHAGAVWLGCADRRRTEGQGQQCNEEVA